MTAQSPIYDRLAAELGNPVPEQPVDVSWDTTLTLAAEQGVPGGDDTRDHGAETTGKRARSGSSPIPAPTKATGTDASTSAAGGRPAQGTDPGATTGKAVSLAGASKRTGR